MMQRNPSEGDRRLSKVLGIAAFVLVSFAVLHGFVVLETYELAAFEAHRSCTVRRAEACDGLLPPWHAAGAEHRTLRARFAAFMGQIPDLTLDAAHAARAAVASAFDALTVKAARET